MCAGAKAMKMNLKRHMAVISSVIILSMGAGDAAHAQNPLENFFNNIGRSVKGAAEALTPNRRKRQPQPAPQSDLTTDQDFGSQTQPAKPRVVADPVLRSSQTALNTLGYKAGKPDGVYGKRTATAIRQFQASIPIPADTPFTLDRVFVQVSDDSGGEDGVAPPTVVVPVLFGPRILPGYSGYWLHTVVAGDTLSALSTQYFGDTSKVGVIQRANQHIVPDPNLILVGQELRIPRAF